MTAEIDPYPVSELMHRYSLGKQAVYNRLEALNIKPTKQGNRSYITREQLQALDTLHNHLQAGGTMADFSAFLTSPITTEISPLDTVDMPTGLEPLQELTALVEAIARHLKPANPLAHLEAMERAAQMEWLLTSAEVEQLTGVKPKGQRFVRGSFAFVRSGKIGSQTAWQVTRVVDPKLGIDPQTGES